MIFSLEWTYEKNDLKILLMCHQLFAFPVELIDQF
jgi:hypothetical protein